MRVLDEEVKYEPYLPLEVLDVVFKKLEMYDRCVMRLTCRYYRSLH